MPKLKPATIAAKIDALTVELRELQRQRQQLTDNASDSPLIGQYIATRQSGGTAFSGKCEKQAMHDYYALVDAAGGFIRYVSKQEVSAYRERIRLGKEVAKLNRAISCCAKRISQYQSKLPPAEETPSPAIATPTSPVPELPDNPVNEPEVSGQEKKAYTVESIRWVVSEAA